MISRKQSIKMTSHRRQEAGFSLLEGLFAAALMLVVAVSILPLFMRALDSNTRGGRASQVSTFVTAELEEVNQATIDRDDWQLTGANTSVLTFPTSYWDTGQLYASEGSPAQIGDEGWIDDASAAAGPILWSRDMTVRKYSFADVHITIEVGGAALATLGDPRLFDSPLTTDSDGVVFNDHFTELRVSLREDRAGIPLSSGQRMTTRHFRVY